MNPSLVIASLPLLIMVVTSVMVMIGIAIRRSHLVAAVTCILGIAAALVSLWWAFPNSPIQVTSLLIMDHYALMYMGLILAAGGAIVLLSFSYLETRSEHKEEFYLLLLLATTGSMVLAASSHMVSLFLGLELLSISLYALISYPRTEALPLEAGIKYLVLAASSSAFLLFGLALLYLANGVMEFSGVHGISPEARTGFPYLAGIVLLLTGIGFKLAIVPFHLWTPDVYQGAPMNVTAFVATVSKAGVFAFLLRWFRVAEARNGAFLLILALVAIASMLVGNLLALRQTNVKRLLAYSSIAHMGYFLVAVVAGGTLASAAATYYLGAYVVTILGAFGCLLALSSGTREAETFDDLRGLFWRRPVLASVLSAMILSLAGIPLTGGFLGKFFVLTAGAGAAAWWLVFVLIISSTIGLVYYLRVIVAMFADSELAGAGIGTGTLGLTRGVVLAVLTSALLVLGVYPGPLWHLISAATG